MLWTQPGHQLDNLGKQYLKVKQLYIYGNDELAQKTYDFLKWLRVADEFEIYFVLDDSVHDPRSASFCGKPVLAFQKDVCARLRVAPEAGAVLLPFPYKTNERAILEKLGVSNIFYLIASLNRRDNFIQNFLCVWLMYRHKKLLSHWTNFLVTARCNLNCKHCLNFNDSLINPKDVVFEDFKQHIDTVFSKFDYLYSLHFTGGEPLLARDLSSIISYLHENYKDRFFEFFVITNSTILPNDEIVHEMQKINGSFLIDDYSDTCQQSKLEKLKTHLKNNNIPHTVNKPPYWFDIEAGFVNKNLQTDVELEAHKDTCHSYLQEFEEGKIYACCYQKYAERAGLAQCSPDEYIDIASRSKMEILEFRQGYTTKGYVDFCKHCRGIGDNAKKVMPAMQVPRRTSSERALSTATIVPGLVSICVPIYNTQPYLRRCIDSLLAQTYNALEIILADDGSDDGSGAICDGYAAADERVRVIHKTNGGEASARNAALKAATGQYVMFIDSDDEYVPHAVQSLVDAVQKGSADLAIGGYLEQREDMELFASCHRLRYSAADLAQDYLTAQCPYGVQYLATSVNAKLFSRDLIVKNGILFDEHYVIGNDAVFMCEYLFVITRIHAVLEPIYIYYKYSPTERLQGMAWYYPDSFFLFVYIADKMLKVASLDICEHNRINEAQYRNFIYGLINAFPALESFEKNLESRLAYFCSKIDLLYQVSKYSIAEKLPERIDVPLRLISFLIKSKNYHKLLNIIRLVVKTRNISPPVNTNIRMMVQIDTDQANVVHSLTTQPKHMQSSAFSSEEAWQSFKQLEALCNNIIREREDGGDNSTAALLKEELLLLQRSIKHSNPQHSPLYKRVLARLLRNLRGTT